MTYQQALDFLYSKVPMFHQVGKTAYKADLGNIRAFDELLGKPHSKYKTIHIAGTNGKGSTSHMLAAVLQTAGFKTGLFTSPHLLDFRERIRVNVDMISEEFVADFINKHRSFIQEIEPSFFEVTTAMAFQYFKEMNVEIAVIEVGLGGRLDSTNIISPLLSVITNISLDHTDLLGNTIQAIAKEKAGIIKPNIPVIIGQTQTETTAIFTDTAQQNNSPIVFADKLFQVKASEITNENKQKFQITNYNDIIIDLPGNYQQKNILTVITIIEELKKRDVKISKQNIYDGLFNAAKLTGLMGRWQIVGRTPMVVCDTGHNYDGIQHIVQQIKNLSFNKLHVVFGMVKEKDFESILKLLPANGIYHFTKANIPRAMNEHLLFQSASELGLKAYEYSSVKKAIESTLEMANPDDFIWIGGSTFIVAEALEYFTSRT